MKPASLPAAEIHSVFRDIGGVGRKKMTQTGWNFDGDIPLAERTVSPSDYGFHNALRISRTNHLLILNISVGMILPR